MPDPIALRDYRTMSEEELAEEARREVFARWHSFLARRALEEIAERDQQVREGCLNAP